MTTDKQQAILNQLTDPDITKVPINGRGQKYIKVDKKKALDLRLDNNLSYSQIAKIQGVSTPAIYKALQPLLPTAETETYKNNRADVLAHLGLRILKSINDEDIKKAPFGSRVLAYAQIYDKERLERGQSTENIGLITSTLKQLQEFRNRRPGKLSTGSEEGANDSQVVDTVEVSP